MGSFSVFGVLTQTAELLCTKSRIDSWSRAGSIVRIAKHISKAKSNYEKDLLALFRLIKQEKMFNPSFALRKGQVHQEVGRDLQHLFSFEGVHCEKRRQELLDEALSKNIPTSILQAVTSENDVDEVLKNRFIKQIGTDCAICQEEITDNDLLAKEIHKTSCHHFFHSRCIQGWANKKSSCPTCLKECKFTDDRSVTIAFLDKIKTALESLFGKTAVMHQVSKEPIEDDETFARRVQEELNQEAQDRVEQERADYLYACQLEFSSSGR